MHNFRMCHHLSLLHHQAFVLAYVVAMLYMRYALQGETVQTEMQDRRRKFQLTEQI